MEERESQTAESTAFAERAAEDRLLVLVPVANRHGSEGLAEGTATKGSATAARGPRGWRRPFEQDGPESKHDDTSGESATCSSPA
jgi:hypothetical protein